MNIRLEQTKDYREEEHPEAFEAYEETFPKKEKLHLPDNWCD